MAEQEFKTWKHNAAIKVIGVLATIIMGGVGWLFSLGFNQGLASLKSIDNKFDVLAKDVTDIKMNEHITNGRLVRVEDDVVAIKATVKANEKDLSKRVGDLERSSIQHEQQLRQLSK